MWIEKCIFSDQIIFMVHIPLIETALIKKTTCLYLLSYNTFFAGYLPDFYLSWKFPRNFTPLLFLQFSEQTFVCVMA